MHVLHAKGAREGYIFRKDVLRNSSLPVLTLLGLAFGELIAGSVVTESVYARSGVGQLVVGGRSTRRTCPSCRASCCCRRPRTC